LKLRLAIESVNGKKANRITSRPRKKISARIATLPIADESRVDISIKRDLGRFTRV
jgi:hypothetical protein